MQGYSYDDYEDADFEQPETLGFQGAAGQGELLAATRQDDTNYLGFDNDLTMQEDPNMRDKSLDRGHLGFDPPSRKVPT